jgi:guanylate kinase
MPHVITITGPSGAGKSTALRYLLECAQEGDALRPVMVPKYTTRPPHDDDQGEVICVETIPLECDLVYEQYGARYGLELRTIFDSIKGRQSPVVILNDVRAVEDVRNALGGLFKSVFIFRESPNRERFRELAYEKGLRDERGEIDEQELERRFRKAQTIYRIYIENIHLFDHVIINSGTLQQLKTQVKQIIEGLSQDWTWPLQYRGEA